jgi:hypothetical protein
VTVKRKASRLETREEIVNRLGEEIGSGIARGIGFVIKWMLRLGVVWWMFSTCYKKSGIGGRKGSWKETVEVRRGELVVRPKEE